MLVWRAIGLLGPLCVGEMRGLVEVGWLKIDVRGGRGGERGRKRMGYL
jgi:hypothetical protein